MYRFRVEKKEKLLDGRTITYFSQKVGITRERLSNILGGKKTIRKPIAFCIVKTANIKYEISEFFEEEL